MSYSTITLERRDRVALLTLNRPAVMNAMNRVMLEEMQAACNAVEADDGVHALVLTGAGNAFSSGFDLKEQAANRPQGVGPWREALDRDFGAVMRFWHLSKPTVAAVRGPALAGGCELALACDITVAGEDALFGEPELKFGAGIVVMLLPWITGPKQAKELILTGNDRISAQQALALGLVNRVVPPEQALSVALGLAATMAAMDPGLVKRTKAAINRSYRLMGMEEALQQALEADLLIEGEGTADKRAFLARVRQDGLRAAVRWRDGRFPPV